MHLDLLVDICVIDLLRAVNVSCRVVLVSCHNRVRVKQVQVHKRHTKFSCHVRVMTCLLTCRVVF